MKEFDKNIKLRLIGDYKFSTHKSFEQLNSEFSKKLSETYDLVGFSDNAEYWVDYPSLIRERYLVCKLSLISPNDKLAKVEDKKFAGDAVSGS